MLYIDHMKLENLMTFDEHFAKMMKDPQFRAEYLKLEPDFDLAELVTAPIKSKKGMRSELVKSKASKNTTSNMRVAI